MVLSRSTWPARVSCAGTLWTRIAAGGVAVFALALLDACHRVPVVEVPAFHGRVVDARTGAPLAGALVRRQFYQSGPSDFVDTRAPHGVAGSFLELTTDADGNFTLPPFSHQGELTGMGWLVYVRGYMPASGCYTQEGWPFGGCSGFGYTRATDPWVRTRWQRSPGLVELEVRLFPPTLEGVTFYRWVPEKQEAEPIEPNNLARDVLGWPPDPWEEYFRRLNGLCDREWFPVDIVASEAVRYVEDGGELNDERARTFLHFVDQCYQPGSKVTTRQAVLMVRAVARHCDRRCGDQVRQYMMLVASEIVDRSRRFQ